MKFGPTSNGLSLSRSKPRVFISRPDAPEIAYTLLKETCDLIIWDEGRPCPRDIYLEMVKSVDGIFCFHTDLIDQKIIEAAGPTLKVVATWCVGHEHIDVEAMKRAGIKVGHTPGVLTNSVAEITVGILIAAARRFFEGNQVLKNGGWHENRGDSSFLCGQQISGSTVGIYGAGRIGQAIMDRLKPFKPARFLYSGRREKPEILIAKFVDFETLLRESDFVVVTCSLNDDTRGIFDKKAFSLMKPNAVFVNSSRGGVVCQDALIEALKAKRIFAAGLDVMSPEPLPLGHELAKLKNCALIPHLGSATVKTRYDMAELTARNILAGLQGTELPAEVKLN